MGWLDRLREWRSRDSGDTLFALLLKADTITREQAMGVPAFAACVRFISETIASLPIKLYREQGGKTMEVPDDPRVFLLNDDTRDIMSGWQLKQALVADMLIEGAGYAYINRYRNNVVSLHHVARRHISFLPGTDPIFKRCGIMVGGAEYRDFDFIKATRASIDGVRGTGILAENQLVLSLAHNTLRFENSIVKTGGHKRGFLKSEKKLDKNALDELKETWSKKYSSPEDAGVMVLNAGLDFKETAATSVELQLNERKQTYANDICSLFGLSPAVISGKANDEEYASAVKSAFIPSISALEAALNHDLLLESEKQTCYWAVDTKELLRGSVEKRYAAYRDAIESNVLQIDEARYMENLPPLGVNFIKLGLQDVLFDPATGKVYTPNTGQTEDLKAGTVDFGGKEGEKDDEN